MRGIVLPFSETLQFQEVSLQPCFLPVGIVPLGGNVKGF